MKGRKNIISQQGNENQNPRQHVTLTIDANKSEMTGRCRCGETRTSITAGNVRGEAWQLF